MNSRCGHEGALENAVPGGRAHRTVTCRLTIGLTSCLPIPGTQGCEKACSFPRRGVLVTGC